MGARADFPFTGYRAALLAGNVELVEGHSATPTGGTFVIDTVVYHSGANPPQLGQPLQIFIKSTGLGQLNVRAVIQEAYEAEARGLSPNDVVREILVAGRPTTVPLGTPEDAESLRRRYEVLREAIATEEHGSWTRTQSKPRSPSGRAFEARLSGKADLYRFRCVDNRRESNSRSQPTGDFDFDRSRERVRLAAVGSS